VISKVNSLLKPSVSAITITHGPLVVIRQPSGSPSVACVRLCFLMLDLVFIQPVALTRCSALDILLRARRHTQNDPNSEYQTHDS